MDHYVIGIVGGSGLYALDSFKEVERVKVETPFGDPSDEFVVGKIEGVTAIFLPRHGTGHRRLPSEINYRANIWGFAKLGARALISVSAVGSMREDIRPGDLVVVDQFVDRTQGRAQTFFGEGIVGHISLADPTCAYLSELLYASAKATGARVHKGGTYVCIEGPQFSTRAESRIYRSWGVDVIGMTNIPEVKLAREAGLCFATLAMATDYDCWHEEEEDVSIAAVLAIMKKNVEMARRLLVHVVGRYRPAACACGEGAKHAVVTDPAVIPAATKERLALILGEGQP